MRGAARDARTLRGRTSPTTRATSWTTRWSTSTGRSTRSPAATARRPRQRSTPTTRPRSAGRRGPTCPVPQRRRQPASSTAPIVATGGWGDGGPAVDTWVYDPAGDAWSAAADAPVALSASGQAVLDGKLYTVGGCTTADCLPMSNAVAAYDLASDSWQELADYPDSVAFASCGGIDGQVYCTGGNDGDAASTATYAYDPSADSWSPVADAPVDLWASASASAGGTLVGDRRGPGRRDHQRGVRLRPGQRQLDRPAQQQRRPLPRRRCLRVLQGRWLRGELRRHPGQRDAARPRGLRRRRRGRRVAVGRPHHGDPAAGAVGDGHGHHRPERAAAGRLHGRGHDRRGRSGQRRARWRSR